MTESTEVGWAIVPEVISPKAAEELAATCEGMLTTGEDERPGDKRHGGTHRLVEVEQRLR